MKLTATQKKSIGAILALGTALTEMSERMIREADLATGRGRGLLEKARAESYVKDYQRFLVLCVLHPGEVICPLDGADDLWHAHILDTRRYHDDCQAIFGRYLHHMPASTCGRAGTSSTWERYRDAFTPGKGFPALLKPLAYTKEQAGRASVMAVDCYTGHCGGA